MFDTDTRLTLQRIAAHVLARRRHQVAGRFGLRASPGGIATPAFGDGPEVVRLSGTTLVHETGGKVSRLGLQGATLRALATHVGADIEADFSVGTDSPAVGDPDAPLTLDPETVDALADWYALGWRVMDLFVSGLPPDPEAATIQLWPEHFDAGTNVALGAADRMNIGFSPGDSFSASPYVYVGPWSAERPGDPSFWNAPFGAVLPADRVLGQADPALVCLGFLETGLRLASGDRGPGSGSG